MFAKMETNMVIAGVTTPATIVVEKVGIIVASGDLAAEQRERLRNTDGVTVTNIGTNVSISVCVDSEAGVQSSLEKVLDPK